MLIGKPPDIPSSEITSRKTQVPQPPPFSARSRLRRGATGAAALGAERLAELFSPRIGALAGTKLQTVKSPLTTTGEQLTSFDDITHYNNFYEFGVDKDEPAKNAGGLPTRPWTVQVEGKVKTAEDLRHRRAAQAAPAGRSRLSPSLRRGVEHGDSLGRLLALGVHQAVRSAASAQSTCSSSPTTTGTWRSGRPRAPISWPYSEGLRMDEAMNPLTLLTFGLYGEVLPNQDGAPVRIVVPWKYGFKSAKSIVTVRFLDKQPPTTWNDQAPNEYGFYSNVNPNVDHPRWSQKTERRIGLPFYAQRRTTLMFNGYGDQVASLYTGMNLKRYY